MVSVSLIFESPNNKCNNNIYNENYENKNKNKNTENNNRSDIPKSRKIVFGTNNEISSTLKNNREQCGSITVPYTNNRLLFPLYSKVSSSTKNKYKPTQK